MTPGFNLSISSLDEKIYDRKETEHFSAHFLVISRRFFLVRFGFRVTCHSYVKSPLCENPFTFDELKKVIRIQSWIYPNISRRDTANL